MGPCSILGYCSLGPVYEFEVYTFHLGQIISTVVGQVDHGSQHGNSAEPESTTKCLKLTTP